MNKKLLIRCAIGIAASLLIGFLSSAATEASVEGWYSTLEKPFFRPGAWLFTTGWILTYIFLGLAAGMIWSKGFYHKWVKVALYHAGFQLILTAFWPLLFFGFQKPFFGFLILVALLIMVYFTRKRFRVVSENAAYMLYPYALWILYMAALNFEIWRLN